MTMTNYAETFNARLKKTKSDYLTFEQRLDEALQNPENVRKLNLAIARLRSKYRNEWKTWQDIGLPESKEETLDNIIIDTTIQRALDFDHVCMIIRDFNPGVVQNLCLYRTLEDSQDFPEGKFPLWEAQHTGVALYAIGKYIFNIPASEMIVPVTRYVYKNKADARKAFRTLNGKGRKPFDVVDYFQQDVLSYRCDNDRSEASEYAHLKQNALENSGMFATHKKFGNLDEAGAMSNLSQFKEPYDIKVHDAVFKTWAALSGGKLATKPFAGIVSYQLYNFWALANKDKNIKITQQYIQKVADALNAGYLDGYDADKLQELAKVSWRKHHQKMQGLPVGSKKDPVGVDYSREEDEGCFMLAQIAHFIDDVPVPAPGKVYGRWQVPEEDLSE